MCLCMVWDKASEVDFLGSCEVFTGRGPVVSGAGNWLLMLELPAVFAPDLVSLK